MTDISDTADRISRGAEELAEENAALRKRLYLLENAGEGLAHYARCAVEQFSSGRAALDMTLFPHLIALWNEAVKEDL